MRRRQETTLDPMLSLRSKVLLHRTRAQPRCWTPYRACLDVQDKQVTLCQQIFRSKWKKLPSYYDYQVIWIRPSTCNMSKSMRPHPKFCVPSERKHVRTSDSKIIMGTHIGESSFTRSMDKSSRNACVFIENVTIAFSGRYQKLREKQKHLSPMWDKGELKVYLEDHTSLIDQVYLGRTQHDTQTNPRIVAEKQKYLRRLRGATRIFKWMVFLIMNKKLCHGVMICRAKQTQECRTFLWIGTHNSGLLSSQSCISLHG